MSATSLVLAEADAPRASVVAVGAPDSGDLRALQRLGAEHVAWPEDAIVLSAQARDVLRGLTRAAVRVLAFWDHRVRRRRLASGTYVIDAAACLRVVSLT